MMPRGVTNANPGNIRLSDTQWLGLAETQADPDFFQFISSTYGIRAIARILKTYQREGVSTLREAINRWAPPTENDTGSYVSDVCQQCDVEPDDTVDFTAIMPQLVKAIIRHENGTNNGASWYPDATINYAVALA